MTKAKQLLESLNEGSSLDSFVKQYIFTMLWASTDPGTDDPLDKNYNLNDISGETMKQIKTDCEAFIKKAEDLIDNDGGDHEGDYSQAGHDFFLTRNHHGAGFWDGDWKKGKELTDISHSFGEIYPYIGDDDKIYI